MNAMKLRLSALCGAALLGATTGVPAETGAAAKGVPVPDDRVEAVSGVSRSALWQAVDAQHRGQGVAVDAERRLSAEQRLELREQVRRVAPVKPIAQAPVELPAR